MKLLDKLIYVILWFIILAIGCTKDKPISSQKDQFFKSFGSDYMGEAVDLTFADNNYYLLGNVWDEDGNSTILLVKTDVYGDLVWQKTFNDDEKSKTASQFIRNAETGKIAVVGTITVDDDSLYQDVLFLLFDEGTQETTQKEFSRSLIQMGRCLIEDENGFMVAAVEQNVQSTTSNLLFYHLDPQGELLKSPRELGGQDINQAFPSQNSEMAYFVGFNGTYPGVYFGLTDKSVFGPVLFQINGKIKALVESPAGEIFACGELNNGENGGTDGFIAKIDNIETAEYDWLIPFGESGDDTFNHISVTPDNELMLVGSSENSQLNTTDIYIVKTDFDGRLLKETKIGGTNNEYGIKIIPESDNTFVVEGTTYFEDNALISLIKQSFE